MNSLVLAIVGIAMMAAGYLLYSKFLGKSIFRLSENYTTPAHRLKDGVDYVPTNKYVLWGHHFTSVAGAAPIIGPAVAVIWGWLPAFLWVTLGTFFIAGMHDLGALWASQRHKGQSIGTLSGRYIGKRGRNLFLIVIFLLLLMVNAAFAVVISNLLISTPSAVIPTWGAIAVALLIGQAIYRLNWNLPLVSLVGVVALYSLMVLGDRFPVVLPETVLGIPANGVWIILLFIYAFIASLLPVWVLLQPRDYINGLQLFVGLIILYGSFLITRPELAAPAVRENVPDGTPGFSRCFLSPSPAAPSLASTASWPRVPRLSRLIRKPMSASWATSVLWARVCWRSAPSSPPPLALRPWRIGRKSTPSGTPAASMPSCKAAAR